MLTREDIKKIILACRLAGEYGLRNGCKATIQTLEVDFLKPPDDFLGVGGNPAIFVNRSTYRLLGRYHQTWKTNETIAVKEHFLEEDPMQIIGILVHETGHAFNIAAGIINSEANAYIFEIEILTRWFKNGHSLLFNCSHSEIQGFFESRLPCYRAEMTKNDYLSKLVTLIEQKNILKDDVHLYQLFTMDPVESPGDAAPAVQIEKFKSSCFFKPRPSSLKSPHNPETYALKMIKI
jgi:hypothetical protein